MGKPAARIGDTTAHGGSIILGNPLVLIGKMPASALGDMHVCPMCTPAVPPIPHVGGPILMGSTGVLVGKKPAARVSDPTLCVGPPSMPAMGCMTVLLGEAGSGSQAGSAGAAAAALAAKKKGPKAIEPYPIAPPPDKPSEIHTVECEFVDSAGRLLSGIPYKIKDPDNKDILGVSTSDGKAYHGGYIKAGSFTLEVPAISEVKWSKVKAGVKDKVKYSAKIEGFDDGTPAFVTIMEEAGTRNRMLEFIACKVSGGKIEGEWLWQKSYLLTEEAGADHGAPVYLFQVVVGCMVGHSGPLTLSDTLKVKVTDPEGKAVKDMDYELSLPGGEVVTGKLDGAGTVTRENVPPGRHSLRLIDPRKAEKAASTKAKEPKAKKSHAGTSFGKATDSEVNDSSSSEDSKQFEGFIFYSPANEEYLMFETEEKFKAFSLSVEKSHSMRGKTALAWQEKNARKRQEELEKIRKEWEAVFEGQVIGDADSGLEELLLVKGNKRWGKTTAFVHVPKAWKKNDKKIPGRWVKNSDRALQKALDEVLKKGEEKKEGHWEAKLKWKLFEGEPKVGSIWPWSQQKQETKKERWEFTSEAALGRYISGYTGESGWDLKEGELALEASGQASFSLIEGKHAGKFFMPNRKGIDLLHLLCSEKGKSACIDTNRQCCLRLTLAGEVNMFTGVSVSGALAFPALDLSKDIKKVKVGAGAGVSGLAGSQVKGSIRLIPEWSTEAEGEFKALGEVGGEAGATAGLAGEISFKISYERGRFHVHFKAGAAFGLGGKAGWVFETDVKEGAALINHLLRSVDYHYVVELTEDAFTAYKDYSFAIVAESKLVLSQGAHMAMARVHHFSAWLEKNMTELKDIKGGIAGAPLRQIIYQALPPEALGQTIITIMVVREESDFDLIMDILNAADSAHALKWVLRTVAQTKLPPKSNPSYEKQKEEATQIGIQKINNFGSGVGYSDMNGNSATENTIFLKRFKTFIEKNKVGQ